MSGIATVAAALLAVGASYDEEPYRAEIEVTGIVQSVSSAPDSVAPPGGEDSASSVSAKLHVEADLGEVWSAAATVEGWEGDGFRRWQDLRTLSPVNGDLAVRTHVAVTEAYLTAAPEDTGFSLSLGKVDATRLFCESDLAGDPRNDFTNYAFRSSTAIQYPGGDQAPYSPAAWLNFRPRGQRVDFTLGWAAMDHDELDGESYLFGEVRVWRPFITVGVFGWQTGGTYDFLDLSDQKDDPSGFGAYVDWKFRGDFSIFAKAAFADEDVSWIASSWSTGLKIAGTPWNRPGDSLGIAYAKSVTSDIAAPVLDANEGVFEAYYRLNIVSPDKQSRRPGIDISPHYQSITNAGGREIDAKTNIVGVRIRAVLEF
ncbi:MAG: carbohydrate porin [Planctomycetota bacterium]|jgi:hypothetical protein